VVTAEGIHRPWLGRQVDRRDFVEIVVMPDAHKVTALQAQLLIRVSGGWRMRCLRRRRRDLSLTDRIAKSSADRLIVC
jgi:hypothetical protein